MGLESFDETVFSVSRLACIHIVAPFQLSIRFFDGHTFEAAWENKRKNASSITEQRKQHMREVMIQKWREKCGESNDYTGDDKPVQRQTPINERKKRRTRRLCPCPPRTARSSLTSYKRPGGLLYQLYQESGRLGVCFRIYGRRYNRYEYQAP